MRSPRTGRVLLALLCAQATATASPPPAAVETPDAAAGTAATVAAEPAARWRLGANAGFEIDDDIAGATDFRSYSFGLQVEYGNWLLGASTSWVEIDGPQILLGDIRLPDRLRQALDDAGLTIADVVDQRSADKSASGVGDVLLRLAHAWPEQRAWPFVELEGTVKLPTADENDLLGTGKVDFTLEVEVAKTFGVLTPFAAGGVVFYGSPVTQPAFFVDTAIGPVRIPASRVDLDPAFYVTAGVDWQVLRALDIGVMYDWSQSPVAGVADSHEMLPYASLQLGPRVRLAPYLVIGLSREAPDYGFAMQIVFSYEPASAATSPRAAD